MVTIVVQDKAGASKRHAIPKEEIKFGRMHSGNDVVMPAANVSKHHARLFRQGGRLLIEDLGSTCGTYLNGAKVTTAQAFKAGDKLYIGDFVVELEEEDELSADLVEEDDEPAAAPQGARSPVAGQGPPPTSLPPTSPEPALRASGPLPAQAPTPAPSALSGRTPAQLDALHTALGSLTVAVEALYRMVLDDRQKPPMSMRAAAAIEETRNALIRYQKG